MTQRDVNEQRIEQRPVRVVVPNVERAATGKLIRTSFDSLPGVYIHDPLINLVPGDLGYSERGGRDAVYSNIQSPDYTERGQSLPPEWQRDDFKDQMKARIQAAIDDVKNSEVVVFAGGRDYEPLLLGLEENPRAAQTQRYSVFDIRDVVESYMLLAAVAQGKTIHATCRGFQMVTGNMMKIFGAAEDQVPICQHLPDFLEKHSESGQPSQHHGGGEIMTGFDAAMRNSPYWHTAIVSSYNLKGQPSALKDVAGISHDIMVREKGGMLHDALDLLRASYTEKPEGIREENGCLIARLASAHHQGWAVPQDDRKTMQKLRRSLKAAGGRVVAYSHDKRDAGVNVLEAVEFSRKIDPEALEKIQKRLTQLNELLGLDIELPLPDLEKTPNLRVDIPHAMQPHPEVNVLGEAMLTPALTVAFARAKAEARDQDKDIGSYREWSANVALETLPEIMRVMPEPRNERRQIQGISWTTSVAGNSPDQPVEYHYTTR